MLKNDYFILALKAGCYRERGWVVSVFSVTSDETELWKQNPYPYRIVNTMMGCFYVDPSRNGTLSKIDDAEVGQPLFGPKDRIDLNAGDLPNLARPVNTTIGNAFFNACALVYPFGAKVPYMEGKINVGRVENAIVKILEGTPPPGTERRPDRVYVDEYLKLAEAMDYLAGFTQLFTWAATERTMTVPPGLNEYKRKLIEENKDRLHDPAVISRIGAALVAKRKEYLKGDPGGENFLISGKSHDVVGLKLFGMLGAEAGLGDNSTEMTLIQNSLAEGWDVNEFPAMNDSLRGGSFSRGAETELGGVAVKWLLRASSNLAVTGEDCGSQVGEVIDVSNETKSKLIGFSVITKEGPKRVLTEEEAGAYLGKRVMVRTPMFCHFSKTDYCKTCVGERLAANPNGLSIAVSDYGSTFMYIKMGAAHGKALKLAKMDFKKAIV